MTSKRKLSTRPFMVSFKMKLLFIFYLLLSLHLFSTTLGLATATCLLPILINEHSELADPENFILETEEALKNRRIIFHNEKFGDRLKVFLRYFQNINIL